jgi:hypothetical protein
MATRAERYRNAVSARARYADQLSRITTDIADEQQRYQAERSYLEQMRSELNALDLELSKVETQDQAALELLRFVDKSQIEAVQARAARAERAERERALPGNLRPLVAADDRVIPGKQATFATSAVQALQATGEDALTREQAAEVLRVAQQSGLAESELARVQRAAAGTRRAAVGPEVGGRPLTREQQEELARVERAIGIIEYGGPSGIAGGASGDAVVRRRQETALTPDELFATEDDAFEAYLTLLDDGRVTVDEMATRFPTASPEQLQTALTTAQRVYNEAKAKKAYRNDQRKLFNDRYLNQARQVAEAQTRVEQIRPEYTDPVRERSRRLLRERGIDPDDPYLQFYGTALYKYAPAADRIIEQTQGELPIEAASKEQHGIVRLLEQYEATGTQWKVSDLEKQLSKTLKGEELENAIGFALAYDRQRQEGAKPQTQLQMQVEERRKQDEFKRKQREFVNREMQMLDRMQAEKQRIAAQAEQVRDVEAAAVDARQVYARARAAGQTEAEARTTALNALRGQAAAMAEQRELAPVGGSQELARIAAERRAARPEAERAARVGISAELGRVQEGAYEESPYLFGEATPAEPEPAPEPEAAAPAPAPQRRVYQMPDFLAPAAPAAPAAPPVAQPRARSLSDMSVEELNAMRLRLMGGA